MSEIKSSLLFVFIKQTQTRMYENAQVNVNQLYVHNIVKNGWQNFPDLRKKNRWLSEHVLVHVRNDDRSRLVMLGKQMAFVVTACSGNSSHESKESTVI